MPQSTLKEYFDRLDEVAVEGLAPGVTEPVVAVSRAGGRELVLDPGVEDYIPRALAQNTFRAERSTLPPVCVSYDVDRRLWRLMAGYSYQDGTTNLTAPEGFEFDLASIPRAFWIFLAPNELSLVAPLFHDLLYHYRGTLPEALVDPDRAYSRLDADQLFLRIMEVEGISSWRRSVAYRAVRVFGGAYWVT